MAKKPSKGHNVNEVVSAGKLKSFVSRIEKLNEDMAAVREDLKEVYGEAKSSGFSPKILRAIVRERQIDPEKLREFNEILGLYRDALTGTPLGDAADNHEDDE